MAEAGGPAWRCPTSTAGSRRGVRPCCDGVRLTGNGHDAEDVVQDAFPARCRGGRGSRPSRTPTPTSAGWWSTRRVAVAEVPSARGARRGGARPPRPTGVAAEERDRLWRACQALPVDQRTAVVLRFYEDLDYAEFAALTGVREGSVRSRVSRGIAACDTSWGKTMTDLEARLREPSPSGPRGAGAIGLAAGARRRLRRRRTTWAVAAAAVVAAAVPLGLSQLGRRRTAVDGSPTTRPRPPGCRRASSSRATAPSRGTT